MAKTWGEFSPQAREERKLVTVLFADVVDFTALSQRLDGEDVRAVVNAYFTRWHRVLEAHGGVVEKFIGDAVMAVFGLHQSHEDDPHRAVRAALDMTAALVELNAELEPQHGIALAMRVGIDSGDVVVGSVDDRPGQELVVVGETVNRASRLQSAAPPGGILISDATFRHVRGVFGLEPMEGLLLKGIATPVDAYLVVAERPQGFRLDGPRGVEGVETRTIGRDIELRRLQDIFRDVVEDGQWRVVTILGDAGVGKSRLLVELDRWLAELPEAVWWFRGRASPAAQNLPNALLRDVIATRLEIQESDGPDVLLEKWDRGFERVLGPGEAAARKARIIGQWLGFDLGGGALPDRGAPDPQGLRERAIAYTAECFQRLAGESPVVVLLEDLHWADEGSLAWIHAANPYLAASRVLIVATARTSLLERHPHWGEGLEFHSRLSLPSLSRRQSRQLLAEILQRVDHVPSALSELVVTAADGNPFYIEELVKWLLEAGVITKEGETWHVLEDRIESVRVPSTLKGVLQARVDSLSPAEHLALQRAAVFGRIFWDDAVDCLRDHVVANEPGDVPTSESLERLRSREIVYERESSAFEATREFLFKHALLRDVTYESLLRVHRRAYHALAARWLEQMTARAGRADQYAGLIAGHYDAAGAGPSAAEWYLRAGRQATSVHALAEATRLLGRGLEVVGDDQAVLRFDLLVGREAVHERLGDRVAQRDDLAAMEQLVSGLDDDSRTVQALLCRARSAFNESDYTTQAASARRAVELAHDAGLAAEVQARLWLGKALAWQGEHDDAREALEQTLAQARSSHQPRLIGETLRNLALVAFNQSEYAAAVTLLEEARMVHREHDEPEEEATDLVQLASVFYNQARYEEAKTCLEEALPIFNASGYKYRQAIVTSNLAFVAAVRGELGSSRRLITEGLELSIEVGDKESTGTALGLLGDLYRRVGDLEQAETYLQQSLDIATGIAFDMLASDSLVGLALVADERGRHVDAERFADDALEAARRAQSPLAEARALLTRGSVLLPAGRIDAAEASLQSCVALSRQLGLANLVLEAHAALAVAALHRGDAAEALRIVEGVLQHLGAADLEGCLRPAEVYRNCWRVLAARQDTRTASVLLAGGSYLDEVAARIDEDDLKHGFLQNVPANAELAAARTAATS